MLTKFFQNSHEIQKSEKHLSHLYIWGMTAISAFRLLNIGDKHTLDTSNVPKLYSI